MSDKRISALNNKRVFNPAFAARAVKRAVQFGPVYNVPKGPDDKAPIKALPNCSLCGGRIWPARS